MRIRSDWVGLALRIDFVDAHFFRPGSDLVYLIISTLAITKRKRSQLESRLDCLTHSLC